MGLLLGVVDRIWSCKNAQWPPARTFDAFKDYVCITTFMTMAGHNDRSAKTIYAPPAIYTGEEPVIKPTRHIT